MGYPPSGTWKSFIGIVSQPSFPGDVQFREGVLSGKGAHACRGGTPLLMTR
jgi:hypothetical protein